MRLNLPTLFTILFLNICSINADCSDYFPSRFFHLFERHNLKNELSKQKFSTLDDDFVRQILDLVDKQYEAPIQRETQLQQDLNCSNIPFLGLLNHLESQGSVSISTNSLPFPATFNRVLKTQEKFLGSWSNSLLKKVKPHAFLRNARIQSGLKDLQQQWRGLSLQDQQSIVDYFAKPKVVQTWKMFEIQTLPKLFQERKELADDEFVIDWIRKYQARLLEELLQR